MVYFQKPLLGKLKLTSTIAVKTGLHIGGGSENLEIGGLDKPVIRDPITQQPYLPGSSIKGKMRSILERVLQKPVNRAGGSGTFRYESDDLESGYSDHPQEVSFEGAHTCAVSRVFGSTGAKKCWLPEDIVNTQNLTRIGTDEKIIKGQKYVKAVGRNSPARLIVRDCHLTEDSIAKLKAIDTGLYMTEWKFENGIDRITAAANPRQLERVPAGSNFNFELVYTVENPDQVVEDLKNIAIALAILEDDALGGHGSRGYGKVVFENFELFYRDVNYYKNFGTEQGVPQSSIQVAENITQLLENLGQIAAKVQKSLSEGKD
jgi:CRISPR-associated protein Csm3